MAVEVAGSATVLVSAKNVAPGDIVNFLMMAALFKAKAHGKAHLQPHSCPWWREAASGGGEGAEALHCLQALEKCGLQQAPFSPWTRGQPLSLSEEMTPIFFLKQTHKRGRQRSTCTFVLCFTPAAAASPSASPHHSLSYSLLPPHLHFLLLVPPFVTPRGELAVL